MTEIIWNVLISVASIILTSAINIAVIKTRVDNLEKKVDKHNSVIERTFILEGKVNEMQKELRRKK